MTTDGGDRDDADQATSGEDVGHLRRMQATQGRSIGGMKSHMALDRRRIAALEAKVQYLETGLYAALVFVATFCCACALLA